MFDRLRQDYGYGGSYSSVKRFAHRLRPTRPRVTVRVHSPPGKEAQVDFGSAGQLRDPASGRLRTAYAFVMTLSFSRHQYAELVFDQGSTRVPSFLAFKSKNPGFEKFLIQPFVFFADLANRWRLRLGSRSTSSSGQLVRCSTLSRTWSRALPTSLRTWGKYSTARLRPGSIAG